MLSTRLAVRTRRPSFRPILEMLEARDTPNVTSISLASFPNPGAVGQPVTITATVTGGDFPPGSDCYVPVSQYGYQNHDFVAFFKDKAKRPFATVPVENGTASVTVTMPRGRHAFGAVYSGGFVGVLDNLPSQAPALVFSPVRHHRRR